jgi:hypothetical protein
MATAAFDRGNSMASCQMPKTITRWADWDSRRYRKRAAPFGGSALSFAVVRRSAQPFQAVHPHELTFPF